MVLEPNRFKLHLEPCGKQSRSLTGRRNTSGKCRVGVEKDLVTRPGARRVSAYYG